jgi:phosphotransferase family enzyme
MASTTNLVTDFAEHALREHLTLVDRNGRCHRLRTTAGTDYVVKLHADPERFHREARAYTTWVTQLDDHAPRLLATDASLQALLLTTVPGHPLASLPRGSDRERQAHLQAGAILRRLHDLTPRTPNAQLAQDLARRLNSWAARGAALLTPADRIKLDEHAATLAAAGPLETAACHLDYQPHNWLIDGDTLRVLDFEHSRIDARLRDFARLAFRHWTHNPALRDAFAAGYGTEILTTEREIHRLFSAIEAITSLVRGHENNDHHLAGHGRQLLNQLTSPRRHAP